MSTMKNTTTWKWLRVYDQSGTWRDYPIVGWTTGNTEKIESCFPVVPGDSQPCGVGRWRMTELLMESHDEDGYEGLFFSPCSGETGIHSEIETWVAEKAFIDATEEDLKQAGDLTPPVNTGAHRPVASETEVDSVPGMTFGNKTFKTKSYWKTDEEMGDVIFMVDGGDQYPIPKTGATKIKGDEFRAYKRDGSAVITYEQALVWDAKPQDEPMGHEEELEAYAGEDELDIDIDDL